MPRDRTGEVVLGLIALACILGIIILGGKDTTALELTLAAAVGAIGGTNVPRTKG